MPIGFTAIETGFLESAEFGSLSNSARLVFFDLLRQAKAANPKARGHSKNKIPFHFDPWHVNAEISERAFDKHIRTFEGMGFIEVIRIRGHRMANVIVLSEKYGDILK